MNLKNAFLRGTLLLTFAGVLSRLLGFFYRIFLANTIGAEGMGIYQLIFPIYAVCFSLCASGIETAVSKLVAEKTAAGHHCEASGILNVGLLLTGLLSAICAFLLYNNADFFAQIFLKEPRCTNLLKILALTIPLGTLHSILCGYYLGMQKAFVPAFSQVIEQSFRMLSIYLICKIFQRNLLPMTPVVAVAGLLFGEFCSLLFTITCFSFSKKKSSFHPLHGPFCCFQEILCLSAPLTIDRICMNLLVSLEAAMLPNALKAYGMDTESSLSIYGILTGMALPFILFPNALTGSISLMLLPKVSESKAGRQWLSLKGTLKKTFSFCVGLGFSCLIFFQLFGNFLGNFIFSNTLAGHFITLLSWICPFLYLNTTLGSVLNGLGRTDITFLTGMAGLFLRIGFIFFGVPKLGIRGYFYGLLTSQLFITFFSLYHLHRTFKQIS